MISAYHHGSTTNVRYSPITHYLSFYYCTYSESTQGPISHTVRQHIPLTLKRGKVSTGRNIQCSVIQHDVKHLSYPPTPHHTTSLITLLIHCPEDRTLRVTTQFTNSNKLHTVNKASVVCSAQTTIQLYFVSILNIYSPAIMRPPYCHSWVMVGGRHLSISYLMPRTSNNMQQALIRSCNLPSQQFIIILNSKYFKNFADR